MPWFGNWGWAAHAFPAPHSASLLHGEQNGVLFVSPVVSQAISGFLRDAWSPVSVETRLWGAKVDGFISGAYGFQVPVIVKRDSFPKAVRGRAVRTPALPG